ncbi:MAG TPA: alpha/beta hydrolase [Fimbriiglobus sp.]|nr:alpha/beta hydrolase [Fimbriiglobus sp.]
MFSDRTLSTGPVRLSVLDGPKHGPPLWLLHGVARRGTDFTPLLPALSARWSLRAPDQRGHGRSERAPGRYLVTDYVADLVALLRRGTEPAVLVGHSLGALAALGAASLAPLAVRAVVLLDPPSGPFLARADETIYRDLWTGMQKLAGGGRPLNTTARQLAELPLPGPSPGATVKLGDLRDATAIRYMARCLHDLDPDVLGPPLDGSWLTGFDPIASALVVRCPALLLVADPACGGMLPPADADALAAALPDCCRVSLPGVGHAVHWLAPEATLRPLQAFLTSL